jgi:hypothetical protein
MKKKRINITIDEELHTLASMHAGDVHHTNFSQLITKLLLEDMQRRIAPLHPTPLPTMADFIRARAALQATPNDPSPHGPRTKSRP